MCLRALCTMLDTDSLEMGTAADGSVSLDRAELMSLLSAEETTAVTVMLRSARRGSSL